MTKTYQKYKESGVQWIGQVPEHWKVYPLSKYLNMQKGHKPVAFIEEGDEPYVTMDYIRQRDNAVLYPSSTEGLVHIEDNDLLLLWDGANAGEVVRGRKGYLASTMAVLDFSKEIMHSAYSFFFLKSLESIFKEFANGTTIPHFDNSVLMDYTYPLPPLSEQQAIAEYLDKKTAKIDESVAALEAQKGDLQKYRAAVISEAVTRGLDAAAKMKDSGVDWIGEIPEGWRCFKLKYMVDMQSGSNLTSELIQPQGMYPVYGGNGIRGYYSEYKLEGMYVLIGRQGALCGNVNYAAGRFWPTEHAVVCYPKYEMPVKWLGELLRAMNLNQYSESAAQPGLSVEKISNLSVPVPPLSEQQAIAEYLDKKTAKIDESIALIDAQIADLQAYRSAVISEAVTGKVKVS